MEARTALPRRKLANLIFGGVLPLELSSLDDAVPPRELDAQVLVLCRRRRRKQCGEVRGAEGGVEVW